MVGAPVLREDGSQGRQHAGLVVVWRRWHTPLAKRAEFETFVTMVWELSSTSFIHFRSSKPITAALKANISEYVVGKHRKSPVVANLDVSSLTCRIGLRGVVHRCLMAEHSDFLELRRHGTASQRSAFLTKVMAPSSTEKRSKIAPLKMITRDMVTSRCRCAKPRVSKANAKAERERERRLFMKR